MLAQRKNQSAAGSVVLNAFRIMQPIVYIANTAY